MGKGREGRAAAAGGGAAPAISGPTVTFTFDGAGWMGAFHFGVAEYLERHLDLEAPELRLAGVSAGGCVAACLAFRPVSGSLSIREMCDFALSRQLETSRDPFQMCDCVNVVFEHVLPKDEESLIAAVNGRFATNLSEMVFPGVYKACPISRVESRAELIDVLRATSHIPVIGGALGWPVRDSRYFDGCLSVEFAEYPDTEAEDAKAGVEAETEPRLAAPKPKDAGLVVHVTPWGSRAPGWISAGVRFPTVWSFIPRELEVLKMVTRLGYLRAAEFFCMHRRKGTIDAFRHVSKGDTLGSEDEDEILTELRELLAKFKADLDVYGKPSNYYPGGSNTITTENTRNAWRAGLAAALVHNGSLPPAEDEEDAEQEVVQAEAVAEAEAEAETEAEAEAEAEGEAAVAVLGGEHRPDSEKSASWDLGLRDTFVSVGHSLSSERMAEVFKPLVVADVFTSTTVAVGKQASVLEKDLRTALGLSTDDRPGWDTDIKAVFT